MDKKEELMQTVKKMMQYLGFGDAESTIYALLALSNEPLTIMEIAGKINYSIARIYSSISYHRIWPCTTWGNSDMAKFHARQRQNGS